MTDNIHKIWQLVLEGDHRAWKKLVSLYGSLVFSVATRAGLSVPDAEDCSQHTWLALYRRRKSIRDAQSLPAWLIRTAHRRAIYVARHAVKSTDLDQTRETSAEALPDEDVERLESRAILANAMSRLEPRCRQLLTALYFPDKKKSYRKLAEILGIKPNSLGPLRVRCLRKLKKIMVKMGFRRD